MSGYKYLENSFSWNPAQQKQLHDKDRLEIAALVGAPAVTEVEKLIAVIQTATGGRQFSPQAARSKLAAIEKKLDDLTSRIHEIVSIVHQDRAGHDLTFWLMKGVVELKWADEEIAAVVEAKNAFLDLKVLEQILNFQHLVKRTRKELATGTTSKNAIPRIVVEKLANLILNHNQTLYAPRRKGGHPRCLLRELCRIVNSVIPLPGDRIPLRTINDYLSVQ